MCFQPKRTRRHGWMDFGCPPPSRFIAATMNLPMMASAQGNGELVTDLTAKCPTLRKAQMMRISRLPTADQTRVLGHMAEMMLVANSAAARARVGYSYRSLSSRNRSSLTGSLGRHDLAGLLSKADHAS